MQIMGHAKGKQIETDKAVMFCWPSETEADVVLTDK